MWRPVNRCPSRSTTCSTRGHAMEARIYAENPASGFVPSGGDVLFLREAEGDGIRVDSSLYPGCHVGTTYDPMMSKIAAWGPDRTTALARLDRALAETAVLGFETNINFLRRLLAQPDVQSGTIDTGLVERELDALVATPPAIRASIAAALERLVSALVRVDRRRPVGPVRRLATRRCPRPVFLDLHRRRGTTYRVQVSGTASDVAVVVNDGPPLDARTEMLPHGAPPHRRRDRRRTQSCVHGGDRTWVWMDGATVGLLEWSPRRRAGGPAAPTTKCAAPCRAPCSRCT